MIEGKKILPTKLLVKKVIPDKRYTPSGLVIPESASETSCIGDVVLVGDGTATQPMPVRVGQRVMYPPRAPQWVKLGDQEYWLLDIRDILLYW